MSPATTTTTRPQQQHSTRNHNNNPFIHSLQHSQGFTQGLLDAIVESSQVFCQRIWILDNSGSMAIGDGYRVVETCNGTWHGQAVTRWDELQHTALQQAELAAALQLPTHFRLLNPSSHKDCASEFSVGSTSPINSRQPMSSPTQTTNGTIPTMSSMGMNATSVEELRIARSILQRTKPQGVTPLTHHIQWIYETVTKFQPQLQDTGQQIAVILCTDGLPTDEQGHEGSDIQMAFVHALKQLQELPIWLVIRLCTNEPSVTEFYNALDAQLELPLEVLDDAVQEAKEVGQYNPWLNYATPLHRCRELGMAQDHARVLDLLDERPLTVDEVVQVCRVLFGTNHQYTEDTDSCDTDWPDPSTQWTEFVDCLQRQMNDQTKNPGRALCHWDSRKKSMAPWIHIKVLTQKYKPKHHKGGRSWMRPSSTNTAPKSSQSASPTPRRGFLGGGKGWRGGGG